MSKEKQIEKKHELSTSIYMSGYGLLRKDCDDIAEQLYEEGYRKQSENVIELPCRVGDTMYVKYKGIAYPVCVNAIRIDTKKNNHRICVSGTFHLYEYYDHNYKATFPFDSIGKSLFYTEAEAKMKGGAE